MSRADVIARLAALALVACGACGSGGGFIDAPVPPPPPDPGTVSLAWTLTDASGNPKMCSDVNATTVFVDLKDTKTAASFSASFPCGLGEAVSGAIPAATYDVRFYLTGAQGQLATATAQTGVTIASDMTTKLMPVTFIVF